MRSQSPILNSLRKAQTLHGAGDLAGAITVCAEIIQNAPAHPVANTMFGLLLTQAKRHGAALPYLRIALSHQPQDSGLREAMAGCLIELGEPEEAVRHLRQVISQEPSNANARFNLGRALLDLRRYTEAERIYAGFVSDHPGDAEGYNHLGLARLGMGNAEGAEKCFRSAVRLHAGDPLFHVNLGQALAHLARHGEAEASYAEAARLDPECAGIKVQIGWFHITRGDLDKARDSFDGALHASPHDAGAAAGLATVHERQGQLEVARVTLQPYIEAPVVHPKVAICHARVSRQMGCPEVALPVVRSALQAVLPRLQEASLRFAEGDVLDAMGESDAAFEAYRLANEGQGLQYSPDGHRALVDRLITVFSPDFFARVPPPKMDTATSVLVVGMPRSGTSLVEQILSTHPRIHGAGELDDFPTMAQQISAFVKGDDAYPECLEHVGEGLLEQLTAARMESLGRTSSLPIVVDKMPMNFLHLGMIAMITPGARVIHCVRDPVDTCLSCFFQHFGGPHYAFSTQLESLASFYRQYDRLMSHWMKVLPLEIMTVRYEDMVADSESASREMLEFVGVEWDAQVLRFHENTRTVRTASYAQVRRPIYQTSVGRAERYAHRLGPLLSLPARRS